jgi:hypothetical protein
MNANLNHDIGFFASPAPESRPHLAKGAALLLRRVGKGFRKMWAGYVAAYERHLSRTRGLPPLV